MTVYAQHQSKFDGNSNGWLYPHPNSVLPCRLKVNRRSVHPKLALSRSIPLRSSLWSLAAGRDLNFRAFLGQSGWADPSRHVKSVNAFRLANLLIL